MLWVSLVFAGIAGAGLARAAQQGAVGGVLDQSMLELKGNVGFLAAAEREARFDKLLQPLL